MAKIAFTPKKLTENMGFTLEEFGFIPEEFRERQRILYIYIYIFFFFFIFYSTSKRILNFYNLPPGEFYGSSTGVVRILNAIAQDNFYFAY